MPTVSKELPMGLLESLVVRQSKGSRCYVIVLQIRNLRDLRPFEVIERGGR